MFDNIAKNKTTEYSPLIFQQLTRHTRVRLALVRRLTIVSGP